MHRNLSNHLWLRPARFTRFASGWRNRRGKILVFLVLLLPTLFGVLGLVIDGSRLMTESGVAQHAADAAAIAAAMALRRGEDASLAVQQAVECVQSHHGLADADVEVEIPPSSGPFTGQAGHAEVRVSQQIPSHFIQVLNGVHTRTIRAQAIAGREPPRPGRRLWYSTRVRRESICRPWRDSCCHRCPPCTSADWKCSGSAA